MGRIEDVVERLEHCLEDDCMHCDGFTETECYIALVRDALYLLRAQQDRILELEAAQTARVMTLEEAENAEVAWLELYADLADGVEPIIQPIIVRYYKNGFWQCFVEQDESPDLTLFIEDFNTEFRFWTSRPTDEQREAVKWDAD